MCVLPIKVQEYHPSNEIIGKEGAISYTDLHFREDLFESWWIDDKATDSNDELEPAIKASIAGIEYTVKLTKETLALCKSLIE